MLQALRIIFVSLSVVVFLLSQPGLAQAPPNADTFATSVNPTQNFGSSGSLAVQPNSVAYMRFTLSTVPTGATVTKATLRVFVDSVVTPGTVDAYQLNVGWVESSLTWNNRPALGASATGGHPVSISASSLNNFVLLDITSLVQGWVNGTVPNRGIGLALIGTAGSFSIDSKESSLTSHQPELEIALAGAQGPQGPQGPQGIPGNLNPGSPFYIQNGTATQTSASFNIDGSGTVGGTLTGITAVNTTGNYQIGGQTMLQSANNSIIVGPSAGTHNTGSLNSFFGFLAGGANTSGINNVFLGQRAGPSNTTGAQNTFVGGRAGLFGTTGNFNTYVGYNTDCGSSCAGIGSNNTYLGANVQPGADENNTLRIGSGLATTYISGIFGANSPSGVPVFVNSNGQLGTAGTSLQLVNSFNGRTGTVLPAGNDYSFPMIAGILGLSQMPGGSPSYVQNGTSQQSGANFNISGNGTVGGTLSAASLSVSGDGTVSGTLTGTTDVNTNGHYLLGGAVVLAANAFSHNVAVGFSTGGVFSNNSNTYVGDAAGRNDDGTNNTFIGDAAGNSNTTGFGNTYVGSHTECQGTGGNTCPGTGDNNIYIGYQGGGLVDENNTLRIENGLIGGALSAAYIGGIYNATSSSGVPVFINSSGKLGTQTSSLRFKEQVRDMGDSTSALLKLRPVTFLYKPEYDKGERTLQYGLIAEEVAKVYPELVAYDNDGKPYTVRYQYLASMLLNEVQKQYRRGEEQSHAMETQQQQIKAQQEEIESLRQQLRAQNATLQERLSRLETLVPLTVAQK